MVAQGSLVKLSAPENKLNGCDYGKVTCREDVGGISDGREIKTKDGNNQNAPKT